MEQKKEDIFDRMMHLHLFRIFEPFYQKNKEMLLYLLFGGLTTIVSIGSYAWVNVGLGINELIANIISWIFAVLLNMEAISCALRTVLTIMPAHPPSERELFRQSKICSSGR